ncbi:MAG: YihY/virulence factor BrkB family protein [Actinomycetota bacterium]
MIRLLARLVTLRIVLRALRSGAAGERAPGRAGNASPEAGSDRVSTSGIRRGAHRAPNAGGTATSSPLDLDPPDLKATLARTMREIKDDRIPLVAAGMAYYMFLAIFPAVIAFVGLLGLVDVTRGVVADLAASARATLPTGAGDIVADAIRAADDPSQRTAVVAALTGIAVALWSASSGMVALQAGLDVAYDIPEERRFLKKRAVALLLIVATGALGGVPSPFFTFGDTAIFTVIGWGLTFCALTVLFALFYHLGPNRTSPGWKWVSPGGVVGAILWALVSLGFGFYVERFSSYGETYGPFAGIIVLILWLYLSALAILIGGELNAELERRSRASEVRSA